MNTARRIMHYVCIVSMYIYIIIYLYILYGEGEKTLSQWVVRGLSGGGLSIYTHTNIDNNYISKAMVHLQVTTCMLDSLIFSIPTWTK